MKIYFFIYLKYLGFDSHLLLNNMSSFDSPSIMPLNKEQVLGIRLQDYSPKDKTPKIALMDSMRYEHYFITVG